MMNLLLEINHASASAPLRAMGSALASASTRPAVSAMPASDHGDARRNHLIVAFSDQMATPQTRFFGTIKAATSVGRKYANLHLKRSKHTHRHLVILDESTGQQIAIALK